MAALIAAIGFSGCTQAQNSQTEQSQDSTTTPQTTTDLPQVVATSTVLCDLTEQMAQETIALTCLLQPNQDPHIYEPTPSDRKAIEEADLILYGGYNYEPSLDKIIDATSIAAPKVAVFESAVPNPILGEDHDHEHEGEVAAADTDHDPEGDAVTDEQEPDPHIWHNAENGIQIVEVIRDNLEQVSPTNAEVYQQNAEALTTELTQINDWIKTQVVTVPEGDRQLVTTHDAFQYYAQAYSFTVKGALGGLSTEEKPSAARLTELVDLVKDAGVPVIFAEATTDPKVIQTVARDANVTVAEQPLYVEGPGGEGTPAPTYQTMLVINTCTVVNALGGQCEAASAPVRE